MMILALAKLVFWMNMQGHSQEGKGVTAHPNLQLILALHLSPAPPSKNLGLCSDMDVCIDQVYLRRRYADSYLWFPAKMKIWIVFKK